MARTSFVKQLENLGNEAHVAAQYLYSEMAVQHAASKSKELLRRLNLTPRFWLAHSAATQDATYLCLARVFDKSSAYNAKALFESFEASLHLFSREELAARKRDGREQDPPWLKTYLDEAYYPSLRDVKRLQARLNAQRLVYERAIEPARHKYIAHRVFVDRDQVQALYAKARVKELWQMITFLLALHEALWELYTNGRRPVIRRLRYSVRAMYDDAGNSGASHERIVSETKKLMEYLTQVGGDRK